MIVVCATLVLLHQVYGVSATDCGTVNIVRPRVLGGSYTLKGEWPFIASIQNQTKYICGGTIISNKHILTAAHCIQKKYSMTKLRPDQLVVRLGAYNLTNINENGVVQRNVSKIFVYPDWDVFDSSFDADIAILVLSENITFNYDIQPVCIPSDDHLKSIKGVVVGWGIQENISVAEIPKQTLVEAINESYCLRADFGNSIFTSARTFCGSGYDGTPNLGDSGGGFFILSGSVWAQLGIVSGIRTNATGHVISNAFTIYTNLTSFKDYVSETVSRTGGVMGVSKLKIVMDCDYGYSGSTKSVYGCWLYDIDIQRNNVEVVAFGGTHLQGNTNDDVELLRFTNGIMFFLPHGFGLLFKNIKLLTIGDVDADPERSMDTKLVRRADFQNLENLSELRFFQNNIGIVNGDSLWDLQNLQIFSLMKNKLRVLHEDTFIKNEKLKGVYLSWNQLTHLPENIFQNNLLLEIVDVRNNFLTSVDGKIFEKNVRLVGVSFVSNQLEALSRNLFQNKMLLKLVDFKNNTLSTVDEWIFETNVNLTAASFASNRINSLPRNLFQNNLLLDIVDFRDNLLTKIDESLFEQNVMLKSVSFASNKLEFIQESVFKKNLLLEWIDCANNHLKVIDIDITGMKSIRFIDFYKNDCINAKYIRNESMNDGKSFANLVEFWDLVHANCSSVDL